MRPEEPVARIMTETVVVIEVDRPLSEALDCLHQYPIHHLPVTRGGRLAGMLSSADLSKLEYFAPKVAEDRAKYLDERFRIEQIMRNPVVSCTMTATVGDIAERMMSAGVHAVPIVDEVEHVVGIVSTSDLIRAFLHGPPRRGITTPARTPEKPTTDDSRQEPRSYRKPSPEEFATARQTAELLHVEARDLKFLGKTLLYLDQRRQFLERVLESADRFLVAGQDEHNHALLLKQILAAKRAEEHAVAEARVPFPLE
jgi:CBS domain-containing protein